MATREVHENSHRLGVDIRSSVEVLCSIDTRKSPRGKGQAIGNDVRYLSN